MILNPVRHMPQLDGLRAFAVLAVLIHHLLDPRLVPEYLGTFNWGLAGVRVFFVMSGFLITGLLLHAAPESNGELCSRAIRRFYIRRALRIFPVYYLVLIVALFLGPPDAIVQLPWLATYTYNFWIAFKGWYPDYFSHFWSLCVEEQFYLIWPWVVFYAPRKRLKTYAMIMILAAPAFRLASLLLGLNGVASYALTPSSLDALGLGALLALHTRGQPATLSLERCLRLSVLPVAVIGTLVGTRISFVSDLLSETFMALGFVWLVAGASHGFGGLGGYVLTARPVVYVGKISYGIYVYHLFTPNLLSVAATAVGFSPPQKGFLGFIVCGGAAVALASVSWFALERPMNRLKDRLAPGRGMQAAPSVFDLDKART